VSADAARGAGSGPRATILIPSFNHAAFVLGAVQSALDQTESNIEIIVLDDGSTDDSMARLATVDDPRVTVLQHANRGLSRTLNRGLETARAPWVKFLPSDDMLAPSCMQRELAAIDGPNTGVVFCLPEVVDAAGRPLADPAPQAWFDTAARDDRSILPGLVERNFLCAPGALFDRELALAVGGFDPEMKVAQDYDLWLRLLVRRRARLLPERLVRVRWHGANQSAVATPSTEAERARALLRAVAPGARADWIGRFAGGVAGRRGEVLGRRAFAGALLRSGIAEVRPLAADLEREAEAIGQGGVADRAVRGLRDGLRRAIAVARRALRPRWQRGAAAARTWPAPLARAASVPVPAPGARPSGEAWGPSTSAGNGDTEIASGPVARPAWLVLDPPSVIPPGRSARGRAIARALAARGARVTFVAPHAPGDVPSGQGADGWGEVEWSIGALRAELGAATARLCVLVLAPHPEAVAFAREARLAGARVVYDRAFAWEAIGDPRRGDAEGERSLAALADDLVAANRALAAGFAGARRIVHLLRSPGDGEPGAPTGWDALAGSLEQATERPTVTALVVARSPADALGDALAGLLARDGLGALRAAVVRDESGGFAGQGDSAEAGPEAGGRRTRLTLLRCARPGVAAAREVGLRATGGEVVVLLDPAAIDGLSAEPLDRALALLAADPTIGAVELPAVSGGPPDSGWSRRTSAVSEELAAPGSGVLVCPRSALVRTGMPESGGTDRAGADRELSRALLARGLRTVRLAP